MSETNWYMSVLDAIPFPVRVADADTNWTFVNAAAEKLFGIKRGDMLGKPCDHNKFCICGTDNCSLVRARRGLMQTFFSHGDSSYRVEVEALKSADGAIAGFIEMIHDITESANQQENLKSILNGMEALVTVCTPEEGKILFLNDSIRELFGIEGDGVGETCYKLLQGLDKPCEACPYKQLIREPGKAIVWNHKESVKNRTLRKTARIIDWPGGKKAHLEYAMDITALMEVEEALERRGQMLDALNNAAIILLSQNEETFVKTMTEGIGIIANIAGIDRMSVSRNIHKSDGLYSRHIFKWNKKAGSAVLADENSAEGFCDQYTPYWEETLASGGVISGPVRLMPENGILKEAGGLTAIAIPVVNGRGFWGYVLFEDLTREREFTADEIDILRSASFMVANAVIRNEEAQRIREADEYMKLMLDAMPLSCVLWNSDYQVVDCNNVAVSLYGFRSKSECIARLSETRPEYQPNGRLSETYVKEMMEKAFAEGLSKIELMNIGQDGTPIPTEITMARVKYGKYDYVIGYARDLREHKRMMREINRKTQLLQAVNQVSSTMLASTADTFDRDLMRAMQIMAKAIGADCTYIWKNIIEKDKLTCRVVYQWSEIYKERQEQEFIKEISYGDSLPEWAATLSKGQCVNDIVKDMPEQEQAILTPRGVLSIIAAPIFLKDQFWGFISFDDCLRERRFSKSEEAILRSASELIAEAMVRHEMEENLHASAEELQHTLNEAQSANLAKSEFLSSMSHEMRTPLNAVIGMTAIGLRSAEARRKNYALEKIEEASTHLLGVINDILDMSKIESGKLELSVAEFNFEQMLQKVITVISYRVTEKRQQFSVSLDANVPRFVIGDDQRLSQVITNLLANAVKFTPEKGKIHLGISLISEENGINEIRIGVADSGIGISAEQQARLFQSFQQAESGISREYGGTGLGLAISKRLVEMMGGRIWVESEPGKGSRFIFTVKIPNSAKDLRSMLNPGVQWENVRVLVADGSGLSRRQLKDAFDRMEVQCETAADGPTACHIIEKHGGFDVYFIDLYTPAINGVRLTEWIRARGERCAVILISSADWENLQEAVLRSGADKGIVKPILSSALVDCMNDCMGNPNEGHENDYIDEFAGKSLLLAEDIEINREIVLSLLADTGLKIDCAENGMEALALMESQPEQYDVIFMDMQMPIMDGLEATRRIRALSSPWCREVPIIAMTANVFKDDVEHCISAGMNDHIGKPIDIDQMMGKLRKYLLNTEYNHSRLLRDGRAPLALLRGDDRHISRLAEGTNVSLDIRVFDENGKRGSLSLPTVVEEIYPDGFFLVQMPKHEEDFYALPRDEMFLVYFTIEAEINGSDMYVIPARFVERIERENAIYAKLEPLGKIERSQRRDCYRLPLSIAVSLRRIQGDNTSSVDARMVNFSDGGMLIATDVDLNTGESVALDFSIGDRETVRGVVLRTEKAKFGRPRFRTAIEFSNASKEQKERFYKFIMAKQVEKATAIKESGHSIELSLPEEGTKSAKHNIWV